MTRVWDSFMVNDELDMLECRISELETVPDLVHVAVEADVDHQDHPKPYVLSENLDRFAPWKDRLVVVRATDLPTAADAPNPWAREHAQREWTRAALEVANPDDVVLHGDLDEIPTALVTRNIVHMQPNRAFAFEQKLYSFALDWFHPEPWYGTVAARIKGITSFGAMRDFRNTIPALPNAGWHFSWMGGREQTLKKLDSFCHPEIAGRTRAGIEEDLWMSQGFHVDGTKMLPVDVDETYPKWIREGNAPTAWYRPRDVEQSCWVPPMSAADVH